VGSLAGPDLDASGSPNILIMADGVDHSELTARWIWAMKNRGKSLTVKVKPGGRAESTASLEGLVTEFTPVGGGPGGQQFVKYVIRIGDNGGIFFSPHDLVGSRLTHWDRDTGALALKFKDSDFEVLIRDPFGFGYEELRSHFAPRQPPEEWDGG